METAVKRPRLKLDTSLTLQESVYFVWCAQAYCGGSAPLPDETSLRDASWGVMQLDLSSHHDSN